MARGTNLIWLCVWLIKTAIRLCHWKKKPFCIHIREFHPQWCTGGRMLLEVSLPLWSRRSVCLVGFRNHHQLPVLSWWGFILRLNTEICSWKMIPEPPLKWPTRTWSSATVEMDMRKETVKKLFYLLSWCQDLREWVLPPQRHYVAGVTPPKTSHTNVKKNAEKQETQRNFDLSAVDSEPRVYSSKVTSVTTEWIWSNISPGKCAICARSHL